MCLQLECKNDKDGKFRGMAVIAFDTPLEALQAISMFNGQTLFDRNMSVKMDKLANMDEKRPSLPGKLSELMVQDHLTCLEDAISIYSN